jgi:valyl-tRNA synthetase
MSKSLGNGIDPLDIIESHGTDAMRFTLAYMTTETQDVRMPVEPMTLPDGRKVNSSPKFDLGRNFCNKLWNASRFAMLNLEGTPRWPARPTAELSDAWILSRLNRTIAEVTSHLEGFRFHDAADALYRYMWNDFCDWYLEVAKVRMNDGDATPKAILAHAMDVLLRLLHPIAPFITEAIWEHLNAVVPHRGPDDSAAEAMLVRANWPRAEAVLVNAPAEERFGVLQQLISGIREARAGHNVPAAKKVRLTIAGTASPEIVANAALIRQLAGVEEVRFEPTFAGGTTDATVLVGEVRAFVHDVIDRPAEMARLTKQRETLTKGITGIESKLSNENFLTKAKPELVAKERQRLAGLQAELAAVEASLAALVV